MNLARKQYFSSALPLLILIFLVSNGSGYVFATDKRLKTQPGFSVSLFAEGIGKARGMGLSPSGVLYVCSMNNGELIALPDKNGDGISDDKIIFSSGLRNPHSVAFFDGYIYIGETDKITRFRDDDGDNVADGKGEVVVAGLPTRGHFTKTVVFGPDRMMYVSIGSSCNICDESDPKRATVMRYNPDGSGETIFSRGLRNSVALAFHPESGELWAANNGRDRIGDDLPPEELNILAEGKFYGWPYCYGDRKMNPEYSNDKSKCDETIPPVFEMQAHSAPLGMRFNRGTAFPAEYRGDLFIAFHGSWNRSKKTGYKIVRVLLEDGSPVGIEDFVSGWLTPYGSVWGRPVDIQFSADGAMFISDDQGGNIYRVVYGSE